MNLLPDVSAFLSYWLVIQITDGWGRWLEALYLRSKEHLLKQLTPVYLVVTCISGASRV